MSTQTTTLKTEQPWPLNDPSIVAALKALETAARGGLPKAALSLSIGKLPVFVFRSEADAQRWVSYGVISVRDPQDAFTDVDDEQVTRQYGYVAGFGLPFPWTVELTYPTPTPLPQRTPGALLSDVPAQDGRPITQPAEDVESEEIKPVCAIDEIGSAVKCDDGPVVYRVRYFVGQGKRRQDRGLSEPMCRTHAQHEEQWTKSIGAIRYAEVQPVVSYGGMKAELDGPYGAAANHAEALRLLGSADL
jgi:hypothetical protein